jgi:hypothetical protein
METNEPYDADAYDPFIDELLQYQFDYAVDGSVSNVILRNPNRTAEDLTAIVLNDDERRHLETFGYGHITHYFASPDTFNERTALLDDVVNGAGLTEWRNVILVLLVKGIWGIPVEQSAKDSIQKRKSAHRHTEEDIEAYKTLKKLNSLFQSESYFRSVNMDDLEATQPKQLILRKVTFTFRDHNNHSRGDERINIEQRPDVLNVVATAILRYFALMNESKFDIKEDFGLAHFSPFEHFNRSENPHFLFCFRMITFFDNYTNLRKTSGVSQNAQFRGYSKLMNAAGFMVNTDGGDFYAEEANLRKWYSKGRKISAILSGT